MLHEVVPTAKATSFPILPVLGYLETPVRTPTITSGPTFEAVLLGLLGTEETRNSQTAQRQVTAITLSTIMEREKIIWHPL
jgi:hypothetical protein